MQLHRGQDAFYRQYNLRIVIITFGNPEWVRLWLDETGVTFPILLDSHREVYDAYGLGRSLWRVWQPSVLWYYVKKLLQGRTLKSGRGDPHQLGGDFVVDREGILQMAYYSDDPTDRPAFDALIETISPYN